MMIVMKDLVTLLPLKDLVACGRRETRPCECSCLSLSLSLMIWIIHITSTTHGIIILLQ